MKGRRNIVTVPRTFTLGQLADLKPVIVRMLAQTAEAKPEGRDTVYKLALVQAELSRALEANSAYEVVMRKLWKTHGKEVAPGNGQAGYAIETEENAKAFFKEESELRARVCSVNIPAFTEDELMAHRMAPPFTHAEALVLEALTPDYDSEGLELERQAQ